MYITHEYKRHFFASLTSVSDEIKEIWKVKTEKKEIMLFGAGSTSHRCLIYCSIPPSPSLFFSLLPCLYEFLSHLFYLFLIAPLSLNLTFCIYRYLSVWLSIFLSITLSICLYVSRSIYLYIYLFMFVCAYMRRRSRARVCVCAYNL